MPIQPPRRPPPQVIKVQPHPQPSGDKAAAYKKGVAERAAAQRGAMPKMPDLTAANAAYKPGKDPPMSIGAIGEANARVEAATGQPGGTPPGLKPETLAGLQALNAAMAKQMAEETKKMPPTEPTTDEKLEPKPAAKAAAPDDTKREVRSRLDELDDLEFDRVMRSIQQDAIQNEEARRAVKERVKPFDLVSVLAEGEFRQEVPIIPGQLTVYYRSISAIENQAMRLLLAQQIAEDKRKENIAPEIFGLMQTVCTVYRINGQELPAHMTGTGYNKTFNEDAFKQKFEMFSRYPTVLLHALGTHGYWFEQRTREAFSHEALKTG